MALLSSKRETGFVIYIHYGPTNLSKGLVV